MSTFPKDGLASRRNILQLGGAALGLAAVPSLAKGSDLALAQEAVIWGAPLVLIDKLFRDALKSGDNINRFVLQGTLSTPAFNVVGPNIDTLYGSAWLDLRKGVQIIGVPDTADRYYSIQLIDAYGNSFAYIGRRSTGTKAGAYAILPPGYLGPLPPDSQIIRAATPVVFALTRTLVRGDFDLTAAVDVESQYVISAYPGSAVAAKIINEPWTLPPPDLAARGAAFFDDLGDALAVNPPLPEEAGVLERFARLGIAAGKHPSNDPKLAKLLAAAVTPAIAKIKAAKYSEPINGWTVNRKVQPVIHDPLLRAATNIYGPGYHIADEALYFGLTKTADGKPLTGASRYVLRFPAGGLPPVDAFWSVILYDARHHLVENPIKRYGITDRTPGLVYGADGSLEIRIQRDQPESGNWLPAPEGPFTITLRTYQPRQAIKDGSYQPPNLVVL